ncbi:MAG: DUF2791 family P-loop domain-containing protein [Anaerolineae bacterium]|nr:DUF2791 family P-loop domain-containing protein [Anaerolineae bacterium]
MEPQIVQHPQFGAGKLLKTYMGGYEWEVEFENGRRFRIPSREFNPESRPSLAAGFVAPSALPRSPMLEMDQFRARQTLEALRFGVVPVQDAEHLTIGLVPEKVTLDRALERSQERSGDVLAIIGDYGFGKSHFIEIAARRGLREQFIIAGASLDLVEVPPSKAHKIYEALVTSLRYPDTPARGLAPLLKKALNSPDVLRRFVELCPREPKDCPLTAALLALQDCPSQSAFDEIVAWLSGQAKAQAEMKTCLKKPPRLYSTGENARQYTYMLTAISTLATLVGYKGMVVLIDESEHYSLLRATQRERADSFFKAMIVSALGLNNGRVDAASIPEHPRAEYPVMFASEPHLFFLFALTESAERMPVGSWLAPAQIVRLDDRFIEKDIREFFKTLLGYHGLAFDYDPTDERCVLMLIEAPKLLKLALDQHRINLREVIRASVTICDLLHVYDEYVGTDLLGELKSGLRV